MAFRVINKVLVSKTQCTDQLNRMKSKRYFSLLCLMICLQSYCQIISIHSITNSRQLGGDSGYTLDGPIMTAGSRQKLALSGNFGPGGTYPKTVSIFDGYGTSGSLTDVQGIGINNIFFFGNFNILDTTTQPFTNAEIGALYNWSLQGGKLIITCVGKVANFFESNILNTQWGFEYFYQVPSVIIPTPLGNSTDIFNGPFGNVVEASQGAASQGYFTSTTNNSKVLATDSNGNPTLFLDCNTLDLIIADVDAYTIFGGMTNGGDIINTQDKFWANTIVFMDKLQSPPVATNTSTALSVNPAYIDYQWYLNDSVLVEGTNPDYNAMENGNYSVEVTVNGGCKIKSNIISIDSFYEPPLLEMPNIITPNNDGLNDFFNPIKKKGLTITQISIFNRWGNLVHSASSPEKLWDGKAGNQNVSDGVYYWIVEYETSTGERKSEEGVLQLLR
jgi:gliding motility-associated-like protein